MKITQIEATVAAKISLAAYSNVDASVTLTASLDEDDNVEQCGKELLSTARHQLLSELAPIANMQAAYMREIAPDALAKVLSKTPAAFQVGILGHDEPSINLIERIKSKTNGDE